jgi:hypothetical protein
MPSGDLRAFRAAAQGTIEVILRRFGDESFWAQIVSLPVEGMENSRNRRRVAIIDITPGKKIEKSLKASEEKYRERKQHH